MASRRYKKRSENQENSMFRFGVTQLPTQKKIAIYYRQSQDAQVGNNSTAIQKIDLPKHVKHLGWSDGKIVLIDEDEGVSGTLRIDERVGMSRLYHMIISKEIGAVASVNEDRFFRDESQIEPNKFIEACRQNGVLVITPTMIYDFEHTYHRKQFRFVAEMAAEYIEHQIHGRLHTAKKRG